MFAVGTAYKKMFASENFPTLPSPPRPVKKNTGSSLSELGPSKPFSRLCF